MKLSQLAAKPQLIEVKIDDEETIKRYGEAVSFWVYDRHSVETFAKLATVKGDDFQAAAEFVKDLILDEDGKPITKGDSVLPTDISVKAVTKVVEVLGKSITTQSEQTTPQPQS